MTPEERQMLRDSLELARTNNELLTKIHTSLMWSRAIKIFYWLVIIGATVGAFYFVQPYIDALTQAYGAINGSPDTIKALFRF